MHSGVSVSGAALRPALAVLQALHLPADPLHHMETIQGVPIYRREQSILREHTFRGQHLVARDERLFETILEDDAVQLGVGQIETGCVQDGVEVRPGRKDSEPARRAAAAVQGWLDSFEDLDDLIRELVAVVPFLGWSPYVITWADDLHLPGVGRVYRPREVEQLQPHRHAVTRPVPALPHRLLATRFGVGEGIFAEGHPYRFVWFSRGSTRSPYGKSRLAPLVPILAAKRALLSFMPDFLRRQLGVILLNYTGDKVDPGKLRQRAMELYQILEQSNILVGDARWAIQDVQGSPAQRVTYQVLLETFNGILTSGIVLQNLSSKVQEGSRAAATVHVGDILGALKRDHATFASRSLTHLAHLFLALNRLLPADPRDCPKVQLGILRNIPLEIALDLHAAGLEVDLGAVADRHGIPYQRDEEGNALVHRPQASMLMPTSPSRRQRAGAGSEAPLQRTLVEDHPASQTLADRVHDRPPDLAPLAELARAVRDLYGARSGDSDPKAPPR